MTKEMIQQKFSGLLELMALIQNDIENGLFDVAAESTTGARSMIAFNATRNVFMLMSDARPTRGVQAGQRKPVHMPLNCAERRFIQWSRNSPSGDLETGFRNKKLSSFYNATISRSPRALYATGRKAATHNAITPPLFLHNFWRSVPNVENKWLEKAV